MDEAPLSAGYPGLTDPTVRVPILAAMLATAPTPGFRSLGQLASRQIARRTAEQGRLGAALLVHGPQGAGKGAFVEDLLALLFCSAAPGAERPCNACDGCRGGRARTHPDLVMGSPERWRELRGAGESVVGAARRWLGEAAGAPIAGSRRVVLIEEIDRAGEQIQNALLKALEEPADRHVFVLTATDPRQLLPTIRSRCQPLRVGAVPRDELVRWLRHERRLPADEAERVARVAEGLAGRAARLAGDRSALDWRDGVRRELLDLLSAGRAARLERARELLDRATGRVRSAGDADHPSAGADGDAEPARAPSALQRAAAGLVVEVWLGLARDLLLVSVDPEGHEEIRRAEPELAARAGRVEPGALASFIGLLERIEDGLAENASARLALDVAMLAWPAATAS